MSARAYIPLKRFQIRSAMVTAPAGMSLSRLAMRVLNTFGDSLYGRMEPDVLIAGNDPVVGLILANAAARAGKSVLLVPDSLSMQDWPSPDYGQVANNEANCWAPDLAIEMSRWIGREFREATLARAIIALTAACVDTGRVQILADSMIQSEAGQCRGEPGTEMFFPVHESVPVETSHPMWSIIQRTIPAIRFNRVEIEYIAPRKVVLTTHPSAYIREAPTMLKAGLYREGRDHRNDWEAERLEDFIHAGRVIFE